MNQSFLLLFYDTIPYALGFPLLPSQVPFPAPYTDFPIVITIV